MIWTIIEHISTHHSSWSSRHIGKINVICYTNRCRFFAIYYCDQLLLNCAVTTLIPYLPKYFVCTYCVITTGIQLVSVVDWRWIVPHSNSIIIIIINIISPLHIIICRAIIMTSILKVNMSISTCRIISTNRSIRSSFNSRIHTIIDKYHLVISPSYKLTLNSMTIIKYSPCSDYFETGWIVAWVIVVVDIYLVFIIIATYQITRRLIQNRPASCIWMQWTCRVGSSTRIHTSIIGLIIRPGYGSKSCTIGAIFRISKIIGADEINRLCTFICSATIICCCKMPCNSSHRIWITFMWYFGRISCDYKIAIIMCCRPTEIFC